MSPCSVTGDRFLRKVQWMNHRDTAQVRPARPSAVPARYGDIQCSSGAVAALSSRLEHTAVPTAFQYSRTINSLQMCLLSGTNREWALDLSGGYSDKTINRITVSSARHRGRSSIVGGVPKQQVFYSMCVFLMSRKTRNCLLLVDSKGR